MRLLHVHRLEFQEHYTPIPKYVIASHRWRLGTEASIQDVRNKRNTLSKGYEKILRFADYVKAHLPHVEWLWIDTCCVNQESSQEVTEAINSMFEYYRNAEVCLAYLFDVSAYGESFCSSDWFARGWTLQELLAPCTVLFLDKEWQLIGHKGATGRSKSGITIDSGRSLTPNIATLTGIREEVLDNFEPCNFTVEEKMAWTTGRTTLREEDMSYCLFGIFGVSLPVLYGEGKEKARRRLLEEVNRERKTTSFLKSLFNVPFRQDPEFIDRGSIMDSLSQKLAIPAGRAALVGLGGTGKSQLAIEFAYRMRQKRPNTSLFWIYAANVTRFEHGVRNIADEAKIEGREDLNINIFKLVRDWLRQSQNGPWILVLDNVDDAGFLERRPTAEKDKSISPRNSLFDYLPTCDHGSILITSRDENAALKLVGHYDIIEVKPLDKESAIILLKTKLTRQESEEDIAELAVALEYLPLAITQAVAYINQRGRRCSVRGYITKLQSCDDQTYLGVLGFEAADIRRDEDARSSVLSTWQISFEHIYRNRRSAANLLSLMSFCDRQAIPKLLLRTEQIDVETSRIPDSSRPLKRKFDDETGQNAHQEDALGQVNATGKHFDAEENFNSDIALLEGFSFISITTDDSTFQMHRLVQLSTRSWLESHGQRERWREQLVRNLYDVFPLDQFEWNTCQMLYPHVKLMTSFESKDKDLVTLWVSLMQLTSQYANHMNNQNEAEEMLRVAWDTCTRFFGKEDDRSMYCMQDLAGVLREMGRHKENVEIARELCELRKKMLGAEHLETLYAMESLADSYRKLSRFTEAEEIEGEVLKSWNAAMVEEHPSSRDDSSEVPIANVLINQRQFSEAEKILRKAMQVRKVSKGEEHPDTLWCAVSLVRLLRKHGRLHEAAELGVRVLASCQKGFGEEHRRTLFNLYQLWQIYEEAGKLSDAQQVGEKLLNLQRKVLGESALPTILTMTNLAITYAAQGRWSEAEKLEESVLDISVRRLGEEDPCTLDRMYNLSITRNALGQKEEAISLLSRCVKLSTRVLGVENPQTKSARVLLQSWTQNELFQLPT